MLNTTFYSSWAENIEQVNLLPLDITDKINKLKVNELINIQGIISLYLLAKPKDNVSNFFYNTIYDEFISEGFAEFIDSIQDLNIQQLNTVLKVIEDRR
ncbi:MAG: hypothetical protein AAFW70_10030 [Cyanobacteria bacterium J06635_10]